ncbi:MAG TPA: UDP-N-acetylmuramate dehydrogenase [Terriglobales bacterium]|nr:UDP-N-acetylmuramate dehydrogenase [Terriglobales bacterium]
MQVLADVSLAERTTLRVGGRARWLIEAEGEEDVPVAIEFARDHACNWFALGGGSNLLVNDGGFAGVAVHMGLRGISDLGGGRVAVAAGESWDGLVAWSVERSLAGIECLSGIPGTVGATPVQNVGAYGQEVAPVIEQVRAWDTVAAQWVELSASDCGFGYRASRFNQGDRGRFVISQVGFRLRPQGAPTLAYPELAVRKPGSLAETRAAVLEIRRGKAMLIEPGQAESRSAGSFFKNPAVPPGMIEAIAAATGEVPPNFAAPGGLRKLSAAWLLERAGFHKGYRPPTGGAGISSRHVLALVNYDGATAAEVMALAQMLQSAVEQRFQVRLEMEPVRLGFEPTAADGGRCG